MWSRSIPMVALLCVCLLLVEGVLSGRFSDKHRMHQDRAAAEVQKRQSYGSGTPNNTADYQFYSKKTSPYLVESMPDVPFDIGEFYAGNIPIDESDLSRQLFFFFKPRIGKPVDEVTIWLNGGPGCSSLEGFFQENGPFTWQPGTYAPVVNPYSWANLTNMLWVDQPVGTGFAIGKPNATTQEETAQDFIKFFKNFEKTFGIKNYKIYVTGESYAGRYVPYISAAMLDEGNEEYYNLQGALAYDPCIGSFVYTQEEAVAVPYVKAYNNILGLNDSFVSELEQLHESCGYADYVDKYLQFPPPGVQPPEFFNYSGDASCDVFDMIDEAALTVNPCFDIYETNLQCPLLWDVLNFPTQLVYQSPGFNGPYFNRSDVKAAIHAPQSVSWNECSDEAVFVGRNSGPEEEGDTSADPIQHVLPQVIEATNRVLIGNGDLDMIIITNGTLLAIQNMTWNGKLGFQREPTTPINIKLTDLQYESVFDDNGAAGLDGPQGVVGRQHFERGLMFVETFLSGHMQPQFQPRATYRHLQWVLGRIDKI